MTYTNKINKEHFPEKEEIFSWIQDLGQWGHRKTGTAEGRKSAEYVAGKMKEFGLEDVRIETVPSMCMIVDDYSLTIDGKKLETFYINGTNRCGEKGRSDFGADGEEHEFIYVGEGRLEDFEEYDVEGKIVVASIVFPDYHPMDCAAWFENKVIYDPEELMKGEKRKADIYTPSTWPNNYFLAQIHGAKGFVGILETYMDDPYFYNEDYTENGQAMGCEFMSLPGLWISRSDGADLKKRFGEEGCLKGSMRVNTLYEERDGLNVSGRLPGRSEDMILVHSHHDAVFEGAVQDASGISEMLALAKYFSQIPQEQREKTLMFAALDTHYTGYDANIGFVRRRAEEHDNVLLDIAIEHVGKEAVFDENYNLFETGEVETRIIYVSEPKLYDFVVETVKSYDLQKSIIALVPVGEGLDREYVFHQDEVISDAYYWNESGVPVVSHVCGQQYLFHISDRPDRIPLEELEPVGLAFAEITARAMEVC